MNLQDLKTAILADGKIDTAEVSQLREALYADGKIDREEAELLFEMNDAVSGKDNDPEWPKLFAGAVAKHVMEDGKIDEEEAIWLLEKIDKDGTVDEAEKLLLSTLKEKATNIPEELLVKMAALGI